ncbi:MAG: NAD(P)-dependent oxidoreductase [Lachnospiraceae bacterium]|nr:NAD(P)-dependent oxidoreductase [Lachnospiraceae bacterium]
MNVLLTGNTDLLSRKFTERLSQDYKCILSKEHMAPGIGGKNISTYPAGGEEEEVAVYAAFRPEAVVFFSHALDGAVKVFDELEDLESNLYQARRSGVKHFIYVATNDYEYYDVSVMDGTPSRQVLLKACEELCKTFTEKYEMRITILHVPFIYGTERSGCRIWYLIDKAVSGERLSFRGAAEDVTDYLNDEDLAELLSRILDDPMEDLFSEMHLDGQNHHAFKEVFELLVRGKDNKVRFHDSVTAIPVANGDETARKEYGWFPTHQLVKDLPAMLDAAAQESLRKGRSYTRRKNRRQLRERIRVVLEVIIVCLLAEFFNRLTANNIFLDFFDFRLIAILLMGTINGLVPGVVTAILACIGFLVENAVITQWQILFFNIQNWIPFATFFILGTITGYTKDKHDDDVIYVKEEHDILEEKYTFLTGLYDEVLSGKEEFNSQIIGYRDSFGKIYSVVTRLDSVLPDKVFYESINVLEEILENNTVAVYTVQGGRPFARLMVASNAISEHLTKSLDLDQYPEMQKALRDNQTFVNREVKEGYPSYAAPIHRNNELLGIIMIEEATLKQQNMEFLNKLNIISNLISDSFVRATEAQERNDETEGDTLVLKEEYFAPILETRREMRNKNLLDFVLLRIVQDKKSLTELSNAVSSCVRSNDILGRGRDGEVYLLLSQLDEAAFGKVSERLSKAGVSYEKVTE